MSNRELLDIIGRTAHAPLVEELARRLEQVTNQEQRERQYHAFHDWV